MKKLISLFAAMILIAATAASCSSGGSTISITEYESITNGMTYEEVCDIIGGEGELLANTDLDLVTESYSWEGEGSVGANALIMFQGGKVISKSQAGLE